MNIQIKLINEPVNLHIFENYTIDQIKWFLKTNPLGLLKEIERLEELVSPKWTGLSDKIDPPYDTNVYI